MKGERPLPWWERWPARYEAELAAFAARGVTVRELFKRLSILVLEVDWPLGNGDTMLLRVGFSPLHPLSRAAVSAPEEAFGRHQHPIAKTLCLLPNEPGLWNPSELIADYLADRINHLLETLAARREERWEDASRLEEHAPDPLMPYYGDDTEEGSVILFNGEMRLPASDVGLARFALRGRPHPKNPTAFEGVLRSLDHIRLPTLKHFDLPTHSQEAQLVTGRWVKMRPPETDDPRQLLAAAEAAIEAAVLLDAKAARRLKADADSGDSITVIIFADETVYGDLNSGVGLVFIVDRQRGTDDRRQITLVRGEAVSSEIFIRSPVAATLRQKSALVVGCGAIGSFVAAELARSGIGHLALWDSDIVSPGNSVRWLLGRPSWGQKKSPALAYFLQSNFPFCKLASISGKLGGASTNTEEIATHGRDPLAFAIEQVGCVDIVIDATGSTEAQQGLALMCRDVGKPYVVGYGTLGVAGGIVATFPAEAAACLVCLVESWNNGALPAPPEDKGGVVTPAGCNSTTFTGSSFDLQEISLQVVRAAVAVLTDTTPKDKSMVGTLSFVDDGGRRAIPLWEENEIVPHSNCFGH